MSKKEMLTEIVLEEIKRDLAKHCTDLTEFINEVERCVKAYLDLPVKVEHIRGSATLKMSTSEQYVLLMMGALMDKIKKMKGYKCSTQYVCTHEEEKGGI